MRIVFFAIFCWALGAPQFATAATIVPTPRERQAFELGEREQEAINLFSDPRGCGIVLLRSHCRDAFIALVGSLSRIPGLETFAASGNIDEYNKQWADANVVTFSDAEWKTKPRETWLQVAGTIYIASFAPNWDAYSIMETVTFRQLVEYAKNAVPYDALLPASDRKPGAKALGPLASARISKYLTPGLSQIFWPEAQPIFSITQGPMADAQLGVYVSSANEMFESPVLFLAPASRTFLNVLATRLGDAQLGQRFLLASNPDEWQSAFKQFEKLRNEPANSLPKTRKEAFLFGLIAAQAAYNAAVLHDRDAEAQHLAALQNMSEAMPAYVSSRVSAVLTAKDDWRRLNSAATALTLEIMAQRP